MLSVAFVCLIMILNAVASPSQKPEDLPDKVKEAIKNHDEFVEVQVDKEHNKVFWIDYASHATPSGTDCGPDSSSYKSMRVKWASFPLPYQVDVSNSGLDPVLAKQAVVTSLNTWDVEEHPAGTTFVEASPYKVFIKWGYLDGFGSTLAVTSVSYNVATKKIVSATVTYDSGDSWSIYSSLNCAGQGSAFDVENVGTHEIGHVLGLDHVRKSQDSGQTMWPYASQGETMRRTLGTGDKRGIDALY